MHRNRLLAEKEWHERLYGGRGQRELIVPPEIRKRYLDPSGPPLFHKELMFRLVGEVMGKRILCFGCGDDVSTILLALKGAQVWGFDLSFGAIRLQREMAVANGMEDNVHVVVSGAEELPFPAEFFDGVFGTAILHHLPDALPAVAEELARVLKPGGIALFAEPTVRSHMMRRLRSLFPAWQDISPGERQLTDEDFRPFGKSFDLEFSFFLVLSRLNRFVLQGPLEYAPPWKRSVVYSLAGLDYLLLGIPFFRRFAGTVVMKARPRRPSYGIA